MKYDIFINTVAVLARVPREQAEVLAATTLQTLAERITEAEAHDLASELPKALQVPLRANRGPAEQFGIQEFVHRVAQRAGVDTAQALDAVRAVLTTVHEAVSHGEFQDIMAQLPQEFRDLVLPVTVH
ncbi:DUF2267 domain-containing protein [Planosporangium flavigriseum]|nr:DUF2267 domain-containing protein [Planosporangium flavigriseum]NJC65356.1 DUF2267 domain-containing protein [Planosporangium flavigriseum]